MGRIANYLAESLSETEIKVLRDFILTGQANDEEQTLVDLRLVEPIADHNSLTLTSLGQEVSNISRLKSI